MLESFIQFQDIPYLDLKINTKGVPRYKYFKEDIFLIC